MFAGFIHVQLILGLWMIERGLFKHNNLRVFLDKKVYKIWKIVFEKLEF